MIDRKSVSLLYKKDKEFKRIMQSGKFAYVDGHVVYCESDNVIEGNSDIKNYADYLYKKCGGAILSWIIEGARRVIAKDYRIAQPRVVVEAIRRYKENNDWLAQFLEECCEIEEDHEVLEKATGEYHPEASWLVDVKKA